MFNTKLEAVKELVEYDHCLLTPEAVMEFCKPFGFDPKMFITKFQNQPSQFKGLNVPGMKEGEWVEGADASHLAANFCQELGIEYVPKYGRGSRLRECCRALREHLS